jgi:hypothetical protein
VPWKRPVEEIGVADVSHDEVPVPLGLQSAHVLALPERIVEVVEVVEARDAVALAQKASTEMGSDEPRRARRKDSHVTPFVRG